MAINRINLKELQMDLLGAGLVVLLVSGGYSLYLHGLLADATIKDTVCCQRDEAVDDLHKLQTTFTSTHRLLNDQEERLEVLLGSLQAPASIDDLIARLDKLAGECEVKIAGWQPIGQERFPEYTSRLFLVHGWASYPSMYAWFQGIEKDIPLLDVTHFSIRSRPERQSVKGEASDGLCEFECTLKLHTGWRAEPVEVTAVTR